MAKEPKVNNSDDPTPTSTTTSRVDFARVAANGKSSMERGATSKNGETGPNLIARIQYKDGTEAVR
jgi:hypothetical protein